MKKTDILLSMCVPEISISIKNAHQRKIKELNMQMELWRIDTSMGCLDAKEKTIFN